MDIVTSWSLGLPPVDRSVGLKYLELTLYHFIQSTANGFHHVMKSGRTACRPMEGEETLHTKTFRFRVFRINAVFIHSTTNGYRHLMKSGRAACRPMEGEEIPTYKDFRFKIFRTSNIFIQSISNGYRHLMKSRLAACRPIDGEDIPRGEIPTCI